MLIVVEHWKAMPVYAKLKTTPLHNLRLGLWNLIKGSGTCGDAFRKVDGVSLRARLQKLLIHTPRKNASH